MGASLSVLVGIILNSKFLSLFEIRVVIVIAIPCFSIKLQIDTVGQMGRQTHVNHVYSLLTLILHALQSN